MFDPLAGDPLRPDNWDDFIGQEPLKERLVKNIDAAIMDMRAPSHMLFMAEPGSGKTTLARLIARRMGVPLEVFTCPVDFKVIVRLLVQESFSGVLFLDEIHRLSKKDQEDYLTLTESGYIEHHGEKYRIGWLTLVAATTDKKDVIKPLRERFPFRPEFDDYSNKEIQKILQNMTSRLGFEMTDEVAAPLATACVGTPRRARDFALAARDLRLLEGREPTTDEILDHLRIDPNGLGVDHWKYLLALQKLGGRAGLMPLVSYLGESVHVVTEIEGVLLDQDLITFGPQGRELRTAAFERIRERKGSLRKEGVNGRNDITFES